MLTAERRRELAVAVEGVAPAPGEAPPTLAEKVEDAGHALARGMGQPSAGYDVAHLAMATLLRAMGSDAYQAAVRAAGAALEMVKARDLRECSDRVGFWSNVVTGLRFGVPGVRTACFDLLPEAAGTWRLVAREPGPGEWAEELAGLSAADVPTAIVRLVADRLAAKVRP